MLDEEYFTVQEVAKRFRVSRQAVYDWIDAGRLRAVRVGERVRIPASALQEFIKPIAPGESKSGQWEPALVAV